jgi:hypothetical protein
MVQSARQDWLAQHRRQRKGRLQGAAYFFLRPLYSRRYSGIIQLFIMGFRSIIRFEVIL